MSLEGRTDSFHFPPYGIMDNVYEANLGSQNLPGSPNEPVVPPDFKTLDRDGSSREEQWAGFHETTLAELSTALWPVWNGNRNEWSGKATGTMHALACADLKILRELRVGPHLPINSSPSSVVRAINCPPHLTFFKEEDQANIFASYAMYDGTLDAKYASTFSDVFFAGLDAKCSSTALQFKLRLQRPRPYQIALLMGMLDFNLEEATSSMTPSMVSGHSLQGLVGTGAVMERIIDSQMTFTDDNWQALSQYAVDIGDRRVMAGVHYPSDNLASWIVLMRLVDYIFTKDEVKDRLWHAITEQSLVYRLVEQSQEDVYQLGLQLLSASHKR